MQINDLYQTKITCSTYNANIDSTDTVITVKLVDFNGAAVTGKSVTLTCDKGYFNKNGSSAISGTTTKSISGTTNSSGEITATWTASEWGLCTFSANSSNIQVNTTGWKLVEDKTVSGINLKIWTNGIVAQYYFHTENALNITAQTTEINFNTQYAPITHLSMPLRHWADARALFDGTLLINKNTQTKVEHVQCGASGILKNLLY